MRNFYANNEMTILSFLLMPFLFVLSWLYALIIFIVTSFYRFNILKSYSSGLCVLSVGNITLGGSGKTPLVAYLAHYLSGRHRVAVILRGYKRPKAKLSLGSSDYYAFGDEASMLRRELKERSQVLVGRDRVEVVRSLESASSCDTVILDDGFQHWRLKRNFDIVVVDATNPFGNGRFLPAGQLREGFDAFRRADCICISRCDETSREDLDDLRGFLAKKAPCALMIKAVHEPESLRSLKTNIVEGLKILKDEKIGLFCGIANPSSFVRSAERLGAKIILKRFFADHHEYSRAEMESLMREFRVSNVSYVLTTEKDAQRLSSLFASASVPMDIIVLKVSFKVIEGQEALHERLDSLYRV